MPELLVDMRTLRIAFPGKSGELEAVRGIDLELHPGECLALVGESGCGKTLSAFSLLGLAPGRTSHDGYLFAGQAVDFSDRKMMRELRGTLAGFVFQDALAALDPVFTIGTQLREAIRGELSREEQGRRAVELLARVGIPDPETRMGDYPHQLSGGMRQRVMIAAALINKPLLLVADEPTTSLDVTIQAQILDLFKDLRRERGMAILFITHDLGIVKDIADRIAVMYAGRIVEQGPVEAVLAAPAHPYTRGLLDSIPALAPPGERFHAIPGRVPDPEEASRIEGCLFRPRCAHAGPACLHLPELAPAGPGRRVACYHPLGGGA